ncbi:MAG: ABC transporter permease [Oscillospiraceae bacterium]|nr:ABC transporter permease [Oscillospiraceae bacterium]
MQKGCVLALAVYAVLAVLFYAIAQEQLCTRTDDTDSVSAAASVGEILPGTVLEQQFAVQSDRLTGFSVLCGTFGRENTGTLDLSLYELEGQGGRSLIGSYSLDVSQMQENSWYDIPLDTPLGNAAGRSFLLKVSSADSALGNAVTLYYGNSVSTGRIELASEGWIPLYQNGQPVEGTLCLRTTGQTDLWFGRYYWYFAAGAGLLLGLYCWRLCAYEKKGKSCLGLRLIHAFTRYRFLIQQLVSRDFKTKYKRSVLGIVWSFLNPLLTMLVQYVVFSTLFKSNILNFSVYLLTGIVLFNFFSESCGMGINSILGNASLITKVYVPKYIYPVTRVLSSGINMLFSLVPLILVVLLTGTPVTPAILLLPFALACLIGFCTGMVLILSSMMVFFRDTQFLWSVLSMIWMYATPIFYPESIIPARFLVLYKLNPMYHFIRFARTVVMEGISPEPKAYLICLVFAVGAMVIGGLFFHKTQDKFVLHI